MAQTITYGNFKAKVLRDMDLEQEQFIQPKELIGFTNSAIDDAEALIHGIYEDYFIKSTTVALVNGQSDYDLPSDIYGDKIRGVLLNDTSNGIYKIRQEKDFLRAALSAQGVNDYLRYIIVNESASSKKMRFFPTPAAQNLGTLTIYYLRNANRIDDTLSDTLIDATVMDIPEFQNYLYANVKLQVSQKEKLGQDVQIYAGVLEAQAKLMVDTLTSRVPDDNQEIEPDMRFYNDFYDGRFFNTR